MTITEAIVDLARRDPLGAVWVVAQFVRRELGPVASGSPASEALALVDGIAAGESCSRERLSDLSDELHASVEPDFEAVAWAVDAACAAAIDREERRAASRRAASHGCIFAIDALCARAAQPAYELDGPDYGDAARERAEARALAVLERHTTPARPSADMVLAARPGAQVAWDWLCAQPCCPSLRFDRLSDALRRARGLGLDWSDPVERAIAERSHAGQRDVLSEMLEVT